MTTPSNITPAASPSGLPAAGVAQPPQPSMLVSAILGSDTIEIKGFKAEPVALPWLRVATPQVSLEDGSTAALHRGYLRRNHNLSVLQRFFVALALCALGLGGFVIGQMVATEPAASQRQPSLITSGQLDWSVTAVNADGLSINLAGAPVRVRPGETLPNGEVLGSTYPAKAAYVTDRSTVVVKDLIGTTAETQGPSGQAAPANPQTIQTAARSPASPATAAPAPSHPQPKLQPPLTSAATQAATHQNAAP